MDAVRAAAVRAALALAVAAAWVPLTAPAARAGSERAYVAPDAPLAGRPRLALLPLEDFSGRAEAGEILARILFAELARTGVCEVVEPGQVVAAMDEFALRDAGSLSSDQARQLGEKLDAPFLMLGSVLESGTVRGPEGDVPALALALRILDVRRGRVVWAEMMARTGEDKETFFGWGREYDSSKLAQQMAAAMFGSLRELTVPGRPAPQKRGPAPAVPPAGAPATPDSTAVPPATGGNP